MPPKRLRRELRVCRFHGRREPTTARIGSAPGHAGIFRIKLWSTFLLVGFALVADLAPDDDFPRCRVLQSGPNKIKFKKTGWPSPFDKATGLHLCEATEGGIKNWKKAWMRPQVPSRQRRAPGASHRPTRCIKRWTTLAQACANKVIWPHGECAIPSRISGTQRKEGFVACPPAQLSYERELKTCLPEDCNPEKNRRAVSSPNPQPMKGLQELAIRLIHIADSPAQRGSGSLVADRRPKRKQCISHREKSIS